MATFDEIGEFLDYIWGTEPVDDKASFCHVRSEKQGNWRAYNAEWPRQRTAVINTVLQLDATEHSVFYAPALFTRGRAEREFVKGTWVYWVDFDGNAPDSYIHYEPTLRVQSSTPDHQHAYWRLHSFVRSVDQIEDRNRALAGHFNADTSGWDASQILRPIGTTNRKPGKNLPVHLLTPIDDQKAYVPAAAFDDLPSVEVRVKDEFASVHVKDLPTIDEVKALAKWTTDQLDLFSLEKPEDRSGKLTQLAYNGAEAQWTDEQIMAVLWDADRRWEKYVGRWNRKQILAQIIGIARAKYGYDYQAPDMSRFDVERMFERAQELGNDTPWWTLDSFMDADFTVEWSVENLIERNGLGLITGYPGVGKTQLSLSLGMHLASGSDWLGWKVVGGPKRVLVMSLEMAASPLHLFLGQILQGYDDPATIRQNITVLPQGAGMPLDSDGGKAFFERMMEEVQPEAVVIDSFQKISSKELTDESAVKDLMDYLAEAKQRFDCSVSIIHHNRKRSTAQQVKEVTDLSDVYGSTYIAANVDWCLSLRRADAEQENLLTLDHLKNRLGPERQSLLLTRDQFLGFHIDGDAEGLRGTM